MSNTVLNKKIVHNHNKKRNVGLIYEFLIRNLTKNIVENKTNLATTSLNILKTHFHKNSEIYKEFRLLNSLFVTTVSSKAVAANIISEARNVALTHDVKKINKEKSLLIKDINYNINNESFYKQNVDNYKVYATIHNAIKCWRTPTASNFEKLAKYEDQIAEWLVTEKHISNDQHDAYDDANNFVVNLMSKKIQEKYTNAISTEQNKLLNEFVFAKNDEVKRQQLLNKFNDIKNTTLELVKEYIDKNPSDSYVNDKLNVVLEKIDTNNQLNVDAATLNTVLVLTKLNKELLEK